MTRVLGIATTAALFVLLAAGPALPQAQESTSHGSTAPTAVPQGAGLPYIPPRANGTAPQDSVPSSRFPGIYVINAGCEQHGDYAKIAVRLYNDYVGPVFLEYGEGQGAVADFTWTGRQLINHGTSDTFYLSYPYKCGANGVRWSIRYVRFGVDSGPYASGESLVPPTAAPTAAPLIPLRAHDSPPTDSAANTLFPGIYLHYASCTQEGDYAKLGVKLFNDYLAPVYLEFGETFGGDYVWSPRMVLEHGDGPVFYQTLEFKCGASNGKWSLRAIRFRTDTGPFVTSNPSGQ